MSVQENSGNPLAGQENGKDTAPNDDELASKLSRELSNWRRKRTSNRPRLTEMAGGKVQSEPARTIKVRGHETLVIRKSRPSIKQRSEAPE